MKQKIIKLLEKESKLANEHYKFHTKSEIPDYGFKMYFNGQKALIRKLKSQIKKLK